MVPPRGGTQTPPGGGRTPPGGTQCGTPPGGYPDPPGGYLVCYPPRGVPHQVPPRGGGPGNPPGGGYPVRYPPSPPVDRQTPVKTVPSRRTTYAGGNKYITNLELVYLFCVTASKVQSLRSVHKRSRKQCRFRLGN